jgi:hypothetical protein
VKEVKDLKTFGRIGVQPSDHSLRLGNFSPKGTYEILRERWWEMTSTQSSPAPCIIIISSSSSSSITSIIITTTSPLP